MLRDVEKEVERRKYRPKLATGTLKRKKRKDQTMIAFEGVVETFGLFSCTLYALLFVFMVAYLLRVRVTEVLIF